MARTGRRPGNTDTRQQILAAARKAFAERGYDGASIRAIATSAGVDPALVHHYFGAKDKLFLATMEAPVDPGDLLPAVLAGGPDGLGERLARMFLSVWDSPAGTTVAALLRTAVQHDWSARMLREFLTSQILRRITRAIEVDPAEAPIRASLVASQLIGLALARYIIKIEPLASAPSEELVAHIAPTLQRYLTGPLDSPDP
jgi:AcrR family transcriptional regulator